MGAGLRETLAASRLPLSRRAGLLLALALLAAAGPAHATQLPQRIEADDAACDPKLGPRLTPRLLGVTVNETGLKLEIVALQRPCGALLARKDDLEAMRIKTAGRPTVEVNGEKYINLNAFPDLTYEIKVDEQRLVIEGEPKIFYPIIYDFERVQRQPAPPPSPGAFLNYGAFASGASSGDPSYFGSAGLGIFGEPGVLTSDWLYSQSAGGNRVTRLGTTFVHDDQEKLRTLRVGDVYARGSAFGGGAALGGMQYGTNFALRPGLITTPVQMMEAATARSALIGLQRFDPSDPDQASRAAFFGALTTAPYGPVEFVNIPTYDNGEYHLVLRDSLGREIRVDQEFFFNQGLLRPDFTDYSVEGGLLRQPGPGEHYRGGFVAGTRRHGESQNFTTELHGEAANQGYAAGVTGLWSVPRVGVVGVTGAGAQHDGRGTGLYGAASVENRYFNYGYAARVECRDTKFQLPTQFMADPTACREFATFSGRLPWRDYGSLSASHADLRSSHDVDTVQLTYSHTVFRGAQLQLFALRTAAALVDYSGGLTFTMSFGAAFDSRGGTGLFSAARTDAVVQASKSTGAPTSAYGQVLSGAGPVDNAYSVQVGAALDGTDRQSLTGNWSGARAVASGGVFKTDDLTSYNVGASSAFVFLDHGVFASRPLGGSFALVRMGEDYPGVRVNGYESNAHGDLVVTPLQAYDDNLVALDAGNLPVNARVSQLQYRVRPRYRSGVVLRPTIELPRDATFVVQLAGPLGARVPLPLGAYASVEGSDEPFPAGEDGAMYVAGVPASGLVTIHYGEQSCTLHIQLPDHVPPDTTPDLGTLLCEGVKP